MSEYIIYKEDEENTDDIMFRLYYKKDNLLYRVIGNYDPLSDNRLDTLIGVLNDDALLQRDRVPIGKIFYKANTIKILKQEVRKKFPEEFI